MKVFYKIFNSILVLTAIPTVLFLPFFKFITTYSKINDYLDSVGLGEQISILNLKNAIIQAKENIAQSGKTLTFSTDLLPAQIKNGLTAFAIFACLLCLFAAAVLIFGLFTDKKILTASFSLGGLVSALLMNFSFNKAAYPILSGQIDFISLYSKITNNSTVKNLADLSKNLVDILGNENKQIGAILNNFVGGYTDIDIRILRLSDAYTILLVIFGALLVFNIIMKMAESSKRN